MICSSNHLGEFHETELHVLPDQQVVDLTQFDLSVASEFDKANAMLLKSAFRLCVVSISRPTVNSTSSSRKLGSSVEDDNSNRLHASRVLDIASQCHVNNVGFILVKEDDPVAWKSERMQRALNRSDLQYVPLAWCKHGLVSDSSNQQSGILTNVFEIATAILSASDAWRKRRGETVVLPGLAHHGILRDVLTQLRQKGWTQSKQLNPTGESFLMEKKPPGKAPNTPRVSDAIVDWIESEVLCDFICTITSFFF